MNKVSRAHSIASSNIGSFNKKNYFFMFSPHFINTRAKYFLFSLYFFAFSNPITVALIHAKGECVASH
jgi:hypothetical protein